MAATPCPMINPLATTLRQLASALDGLGIPYLIGGSMASSTRGVIRSTYDVDVVAQIHPAQADRFAKALGAKWYADGDQMRSAIAAERAFNVIDTLTGYKVDIFPATQEFHDAQLQRATRTKLPFLEDDAEYPVASAEDILLAKLQWYRSGGEVSDRQWNDIGGLLATNPNMDFAYINSWADRLHVQDLLAKALAEVQSENDSTVL
jgi:hypothetical protein